MARKRAAAKPRSSQGNFRAGFNSIFGGDGGQRRAGIKSVGIKRGPPKGASDSEESRAKRRSGVRQRRAQLGTQGIGLSDRDLGG
jgi:hypothetical protein